MVEEFEFKHCRICSGNIPNAAQACPLCGTHQQPGKRLFSTGLIIALAVVSFFGIMLLGIMSAHAIQHIIKTRTVTGNASALTTINTATIELDRYFARNGHFPKTIEQIRYTPDKEVTVVLKKTSDRSYRLISYHAQGDKEYLAVSGIKGIYCKEKNHSGSHYVMVN